MRILTISLLACTLPALAQTTLPSVEVTASRDRARQLDTAAVTVIGREELLRYGDQSVADALKRVPGITVAGVPGRGGEIRMRGLGKGYTMLLLNGQPAPAGFAIESVSPEQIERVEVMRVAGAETGAQAIAGTINIILRKSGVKTERDLKAGVALSHDRVTPDLAGQLSDKGGHWAASLGVVATGARASIASDDLETGFDAQGAPTLRRLSRTRQDERRPTINLTPRLTWTLENGDTITSQSFLRFLALDMPTRVGERTTLGEPTAFPDTSALFRAHTHTLRSDLQWLRQLPEGARFEMLVGASRFKRGATNDFEGTAIQAADSVSRIVDSTALENSLAFTGKYSFAARAGHAVSAGWDGGRGQRTETRFERDSAVAGLPLLETSTAKIARLALYAQDDWTLTPAVSLSLGARYELFDIDSSGNVLQTVSRRLHAGGPLLQGRFKTSEHGQVRAGLTRTFNLPTLTNLSMRRYTVDNNNSPLAPDEQGNAALLPERAWGLDLAYEHYFSKASMISASVYARRIEDVTVARVEQGPVSWISTPVNAGRADTAGVELEGKTSIAGYDLRLNGARNRSRIASLPGPDNQLPGQAPFSAAAGIDRRLDTLPLTLSASLSIQGGARWRPSARIAIDNPAQRDLSLAALWRLDARSSWRLSASNLLARSGAAGARYAGAAGSLTIVTTTPSWATFRLAFETKL